MYHTLFNIIVFQFKVCSLEYFMDEMTDWEINDIMENIPSLDRNMWESARLIAYLIASVNSKNKLSMQDICKFKWEEDKKEEQHNTEISTEEINRLKEKSKLISNVMQIKNKL